MTVEPIDTPHAPPALGPYSPAVRAGEWVILSGQGGFDPATGKVVEGGVEAEARQTFANIIAILGDCGLTLQHVAKALVFVADIADFPKVNAVYADAFGDHKPARSTVQAAALPGGCQVEIEVWAHV
ncbi:MAG TPA: Rid family detoxifying hydrolase [Acidimicrobiia bacterium]|jgi:2-iminobutanoate/2-iminopropanoate deaminase